MELYLQITEIEIKYNLYSTIKQCLFNKLIIGKTLCQ